ncbi:hypothetical protein CDL15_Pgr018119 [Punica granatum]|uniref:Uncharacterized protein n=1 Tax=Punica granatum TaxID=22663 RepID=A0A218WHB4_PUNGR|nr:hypothetical protein CDL15_Pgr018119 [Punica granatum]
MIQSSKDQMEKHPKDLQGPLGEHKIKPNYTEHLYNLYITRRPCGFKDDHQLRANTINTCTNQSINLITVSTVPRHKNRADGLQHLE